MKTFIKHLFFSIVTSLTLVAQVNFSYAQTAGLLLNGVQQFFDNNGNPLSQGTVGTYVPSTFTNKTTWQDQGQTIPNANPIVLDAAGRATIYGVGTYRQVVKDKNGNQIWDAVTQPAGISVNQILVGDGQPVGTIKPWAGINVPVQYAYAYGQTLSRTTYSALFTAITISANVNCTSSSNIFTGIVDTTQIPIGANIEIPTCISGSSTVSSKTSSSITLVASSLATTSTTATIFPYGNGNGSTTFGLPDLRGVTLAGRPNMGGTDKGNLTSTYYGVNPDGLNAIGGSQSSTMAQTNLPSVNFPSTLTVGLSGSQAISVASLVDGGSAQNYQTGGTAINQVSRTISSSNFSASISGGAVSSGGSGTPFSLIQPTTTINYIIKILPDVSLSAGNIVTSLNTLTGDLNLVAGSNITITPSGTNITIAATSTIASTITIGTTPVSGGSNGNFLDISSGTVGAVASTGSGSVVLATSPTLSGTIGGNLTFGGNTTLSGTLTAASLSTVGTVAGSLCQTSGGLVLYESGVNCFAQNLIVGTSTISSGTSGKVEYNNAGVLGEYSITGTGNVVLSASPTLSGTVAGNITLGGNIAFGGTITAASLTGSGTPAASICVTSGGLIFTNINNNCYNVAASAISVGSTSISGGTSTYVEYNNGGTLGEYAITGSGNVVLNTAPTFSGTVTFGTTPVIAGNINYSGASEFTNTSNPTMVGGGLFVYGSETTAPTMSANGEGAIYLGGTSGTTNGLTLQGKGSTNDITLQNSAGSIVASIATGGTTLNIATLTLTNKLTGANVATAADASGSPSATFGVIKCDGTTITCTSGIITAIGASASSVTATGTSGATTVTTPTLITNESAVLTVDNTGTYIATSLPYTTLGTTQLKLGGTTSTVGGSLTFSGAATFTNSIVCSGSIACGPWTISGSNISNNNAGGITIGNSGAPDSLVTIWQKTDAIAGGLTIRNVSAGNDAWLWEDSSGNFHLDSRFSSGGSIILNGAGTGKIAIGTTSPVGNLDVENGSNTATSCLNGQCTEYNSPGYVCNGSSDTSAINTLTASGIHYLKLTGATCAITTLATLPANFHLDGDTQAGTCITTSSTTGNVITTASGDMITNLCMTSSVTRSSGAFIYAAGVVNQTYNNLYMSAFFNAIELNGVGSPAGTCPISSAPCSGVHAENIRMYGNSSPNDCILIDGTSGISQPWNTDVTFDDSFCTGATSTSKVANGVEIKACGDCTFNHMQVIYANKGIYLDPTGALSSGNYVQAFICHGCFLDSGVLGLVLAPTSSAVIGTAKYENGWIASNSSYGVQLVVDTTSQILDTDIGGNIIGGNSYGVVLSDNPGGTMAATNIHDDTISGNTTAGVYLGIGAIVFRIVNNKIGYGNTFPANGLSIQCSGSASPADSIVSLNDAGGQGSSCAWTLAVKQNNVNF